MAVAIFIAILIASFWGGLSMGRIWSARATLATSGLAFVSVGALPLLVRGFHGVDGMPFFVFSLIFVLPIAIGLLLAGLALSWAPRRRAA